MTENRKFLKAAEGRTVRREDTGALWPESGDWAELSLFIRRRIDDRDLVEAVPPAAAELDPPAPAETIDPPPPPPAPEGTKPTKSPK